MPTYQIIDDSKINNLEPSLITKYSIYRQDFENNLEFVEVLECSISGKVYV
jgi:hypothetical protein